MALVLVLAGVFLTIAALFLSSRSVTIDTRMELIFCAIAAQEYRIEQGKWPDSPGQIDERTSDELGLGKGGRVDEWGRPFLLKIEPGLDHAVLQTHGKDGKPGTHDGDLRVVVTPKQLTVFSE
ncbi:MAG: hypothetical protein ACAH88_04900 [Roseimicrobium sp.]